MPVNTLKLNSQCFVDSLKSLLGRDHFSCPHSQSFSSFLSLIHSPGSMTVRCASLASACWWSCPAGRQCWRESPPRSSPPSCSCSWASNTSTPPASSTNRTCWPAQGHKMKTRMVRKDQDRGGGAGCRIHKNRKKAERRKGIGLETIMKWDSSFLPTSELPLLKSWFSPELKLEAPHLRSHSHWLYFASVKRKGIRFLNLVYCLWGRLIN